MISYRIKLLYPQLQVEEVTAGTGGLCGSVFLNRRFIDFITRKLSGQQGWDEEVLSEAVERFDTVVSEFDNLSLEEYVTRMLIYKRSSSNTYLLGTATTDIQCLFPV